MSTRPGSAGRLRTQSYCFARRCFAKHGADMLRQSQMKVASMPGFRTRRLRAIAATSILVAVIVIAMVPPPTSAALQRPLADALTPGRPSCHARAFGAEEQAAHPA